MRRRVLGTSYPGGEAIVRQGERGDCMYVVQEGAVEVVQAAEHGDGEHRLALLGPGDFFGEMAVFQKEVRSATVRAGDGGATVLKLDKKTLLRRIAEDPLLALNLLENLSARLRAVNERLQAQM